jgi:hypothetical protein
MIAAPMIVATIVVLMRDMIWDSAKSFLQRRHILALRKKRRQKTKKS